MKFFNALIKDKNYDLLKQILIDEIPYLFYQKYNDYIKYANLIIQFSFKNNNSLWIPIFQNN